MDKQQKIKQTHKQLKNKNTQKIRKTNNNGTQQKQ